MTPDEKNNRTLGVREGAKAIGEFIGTEDKPVPVRRVLYLAQQKKIRTFHNGRTLCATEETLREDVAAWRNGDLREDFDALQRGGG